MGHDLTGRTSPRALWGIFSLIGALACSDRGGCPEPDGISDAAVDSDGGVDTGGDPDVDVGGDDPSLDEDEETVDCDDGDPCTEDHLDPETGECVHSGVDSDGDGYMAMVAPDGVTPCDAVDCDDDRADVHPGALEVCGDGVDSDCDGTDGDFGVLQSEISISSWDSRFCVAPAIAWSGSEFGVVWFDTDTWSARTWFTRVGADGTGSGVYTRLPEYLVSAYGPELVWTGSGWAVVWNASLDDVPNAQMALLDPEGSIIDDSVHVTAPGVDSRYPDIAWSGSELGVTWTTNFTAPHIGVVGFASFGPDGTRRSGDVEIAGTEDFYLSPPRVAWAGDRWIVSWLAQEPGAHFHHLKARTVDAGVTSVGDTVRLDDVFTHGWTYHFVPHEVVWTGSEVGVAWLDYDDVRLIRLSADLVSLGPWVQPADLVDRDTWSIGLAWAGSGFWTTWTGSESGGVEVHARFVGIDGGAMPPAFRISGDADVLTHSAVAWTSSEIGIVWIGQPDPLSEDVLFARAGRCP